MTSAAHPPAGPALWEGVRRGVLLGAAILALTLAPPGLATWRSPLNTAIEPPVAPTPVEFGAHPASADARLLADWVVQQRDNRGHPFAILDKRDARVFVFDHLGRLIDSSPVLLGAAAGDDSVAGIGSRPIAQVRPEERTTPAGRFASRPGRNALGEDVVWVDYDAAVSMHRVRLVDPAERRLERLASPDPAQRRISYGCINVPVEFFDTVIQPLLGARQGVVYVLPDTKEVREVFAGVAHDSSVSPRP